MTDDDAAAYHGVEPVIEMLDDELALEAATGLVPRVCGEVDRADEAIEARKGGRFDGSSAAHLIAIVENWERLLAEREEVNGRLREARAYAKDLGFDPKMIAACVKMRQQHPDLRKMDEAVLEIYRGALGIEGPDFVVVPHRADVPAAPPKKLTVREKQVRGVLALNAAARFAVQG